MNEDSQKTISILFVYHSERIEEQVLNTMLKQSIHQIQSVTQKQEIINAIQERQTDIAIISTHIPFMDPYELCEHISRKHQIPVLMIVSSPECVDIPKAFTKGVFDIIVSPYIKPLVFTRIKNYYRLNQLEKGKNLAWPDIKTELEPDTKPQKGLKQYQFKNTSILLAEDNEINQQLMKNILTQSGVLVEIVNNGQEAIDHIRNALEKSKPLYDLILMDIQMPVLDGFSASLGIRELMEKYQKPEIPIIAITAHTSVHSREKCLRSGMVDFMPKPIDPETCLEVLSQWIHSDKICQHHTYSIPSEQEVPEGITFQLPEINIQIGLKRAAGNEILFKKMLLDFFNEYQNIVQHLESLYQNEKLDEIKVMAHTLKGLGGNIGAENLQKNAFLLEQALKQNIEADIQISLRNLTHTLNQMIHGIRENRKWLSQAEASDQPPTEQKDVKVLMHDLQQLDDLLGQGRTTSIDTYHELASQLPESMKSERKQLEALILSYDFDQAQTCLNQIIDKISPKHTQ